MATADAAPAASAATAAADASTLRWNPRPRPPSLPMQPTRGLVLLPEDQRWGRRTAAAAATPASAAPAAAAPAATATRRNLSPSNSSPDQRATSTTTYAMY